MDSTGWNRPAKRAATAAAKAVRGEPDIISLGGRVRHLREAPGMTPDGPGAAFGTAPPQLSLIENG